MLYDSQTNAHLLDDDFYFCSFFCIQQEDSVAAVQLNGRDSCAFKWKIICCFIRSGEKQQIVNSIVKMILMSIEGFFFKKYIKLMKCKIYFYNPYLPPFSFFKNNNLGFN